MNEWIDTHAHLYSDEFADDRSHIIDRAVQSGIGKIVMPNVDHASIDGMLELELRYPTLCLAAMGLHPCSVKKDFEKELYLVEDWLNKRKFVALGEMGTDLYWDKTYWEQQKEAFRIQVAWAKKFKLPLIIHCRESMEETITLLEQEASPELSGVFHCFTGTAEQAERIVKLGFYLGLGGVSTFKNSGLDKVIPQLPEEALLLETDSPYLAPVPHRGKKNEPSFVPLIGQRVSEYRKTGLSDIKTLTTANALRWLNNQRPGPTPQKKEEE